MLLVGSHVNQLIAEHESNCIKRRKPGGFGSSDNEYPAFDACRKTSAAALPKVWVAGGDFVISPKTFAVSEGDSPSLSVCCHDYKKPVANCRLLILESLCDTKPTMIKRQSRPA